MPKVSGFFLPFLEMNPPFLTPSLRATWLFWTSVQESQVSAQDGDLDGGGGGGLPCIFAPSEAGLPLLYLAYSTGKQVAALGIPMSTLAVNSTSF